MTSLPISIFAAILTLSSFAQAISPPSCSENFSGFFEFKILSIPENDFKTQMLSHGQKMLSEIKKASDINPNSVLAKTGFRGVGKCFNLRLDDPTAAAFLTMDGYNFSVMALQSDKSATYYVRNSDEFVAKGCESFQKNIKDLATKKRQTLNTKGTLLTACTNSLWSTS